MTTGTKEATGEASNFPKSKAAAHGLSLVFGAGTKTGADAETKEGGENEGAEADSVDLVKLDMRLQTSIYEPPKKTEKKKSEAKRS